MRLTSFRCLAIDHDDTVVRSTPDIHYPSFVETLSLLRPNVPVPTLSEFIEANCHKGFAAICDELGFTPAEMDVEADMWHKWTYHTVPHAYPGIDTLLSDFRRAGGYICVVSHSETRVILRDYDARFHMEPDLIFSWDLPREKRKPDPYALHEIEKKLALSPSDILVLDDMSLGLTMARRGGASFAWAGWSETAPVVGDFMRAHADYTFDTPQALRDFLIAD